jgi:hypothetical protein
MHTGFRYINKNFLTTAFLINEQLMVFHDEIAAGFCNKTLKYGHVTISLSQKLINLLFQHILALASKYNTVPKAIDSCEI